MKMFDGQIKLITNSSLLPKYSYCISSHMTVVNTGVVGVLLKYCSR